MNYETYSAEKKHITWLESIVPPVIFIAFIWAIHLIQFIFGTEWGNYGIYPRERFGLAGIFFAPLLHADFTHLFSNTIPFLVLATAIIYFYPRVALLSFFIIYFVSGFLIWIFAQTLAFHIGLSYVVYGLASFVFSLGIFRRSVRGIILSLLVMLFYNGMIEGVLPTKEVLSHNISWESHLIGVIVGLLVAYFYKDDFEEDEIKVNQFVPEPKNHFFEHDVFDKTLEQRAFEIEEKRQQEAKERYERYLASLNSWTSTSTNSDE